MRILLGLVGVLIVLVGLATLVGLLLPRGHRVASGISLRQSPDSVWSVVRDFEHAASWWPELKSVRRLPDLDGRERWQQVTGMGALGLIIMEADPPHSLRSLIDTTGGSPFGGEWHYQISPTEGGSRLIITENGWVSNPLFRTISRLMGYHGTMDSYLTALARHFGEAGRPEHLPAPE